MEPIDEIGKYFPYEYCRTCDKHQHHRMLAQKGTFEGIPHVTVQCMQCKEGFLWIPRSAFRVRHLSLLEKPRS